MSGEDEKPALFLRLLMLLSREVDFLIPYLVFAFHPAYGRSVVYLSSGISRGSCWGVGVGGWRRRRNTTQGISMHFWWDGFSWVGGTEGGLAHGSFRLVGTAFGLCVGCACVCIIFFSIVKVFPRVQRLPRVTYLSSRHDGNE